MFVLYVDWGYVVCLFAAIVRVTVHYLTPVPGGGTGCQCLEQLTGMELDGDGQVRSTIEACNSSATTVLFWLRLRCFAFEGCYT